MVSIEFFRSLDVFNYFFSKRLHALHLVQQEGNEIKHDNYITFVTTVDKCKFRSPVFPGTRLTLQAKLIRRKFGHIFYDCKVFDSESRVASATIGLTAQEIK